MLGYGVAVAAVVVDFVDTIVAVDVNFCCCSC